jgi:hypothetical protein
MVLLCILVGLDLVFQFSPSLTLSLFFVGWDKQEEEAERRRKQVCNLTHKHQSPRSICHDMLLGVLTSFLLVFVKYVGIAWMSSLLRTWRARWLNPDHETTKRFLILISTWSVLLGLY